MDLKNALVSVLSVVAIIVVGGFLVYFLGNLMLSILDPNNTRSARKKREQEEKLRNEQQYNNVQTYQSAPQQTFVEENVNVRDVDENKALEQQRMLNNELNNHFEQLRAEEEAFRKERMQFAAEKEELLKKLEEKTQKQETITITETEETKEEDVNFDDLFFNEEDGDDFNLDDLDFSDEEVEPVQEQEVVKEEIENAIIDEEEDDDLFKALFDDDEELAPLPESDTELDFVAEPEFESFDLTDMEETSEEITEDIVEEQVEETTEEVVEEISDEKVDEMEKAYIEQLKKELQEQKDEVARIREELAKEREEAERVRAEIETEKAKLEEQLLVKQEEPKNTLSLEEYESRLAVLKERLVVNNKEFKLNKKEFLPLRRVKRSLDSDRKKLRRREAMVAKQKVLLYGVNNYVDIDEEKAKKLAEDLDLLDGLRLSVQHCEEVMKNNSERYPILEKTYEILKENNENLKADILEVEKAIAALKEKEGQEE